MARAHHESRIDADASRMRSRLTHESRIDADPRGWLGLIHESRIHADSRGFLALTHESRIGADASSAAALDHGLGDPNQRTDCRPARIVRPARRIFGAVVASIGRSARRNRWFDAPGEHESLHQIRIGQAGPPNAAVPLARLDHHAAAFVEADVRDQRLARVGREEQQVAALQPSAGRVARPGLADGPPWNLDTDLLIDMLREAGAVE